MLVPATFRSHASAREQSVNQTRYVFGGSADEAARLLQLGELLAPSTRRVLRDAGVGEGMRVLDVGCGPGSVTFLAAELVGPAGSVTGIDRNPAMLAAARAHARATGQRAVSFVQADLAGLDG
jgi:ubiquinone/menaquinone biosynthesis C-methylase UbiE